MNRRIPAICAAIVVVLAVALWFMRSHSPEEAGVQGGASAPVAARSAAAGGSPADSIAKEEPSHLADALNAPASDIHADLRTLDAIFVHYRGAVHGDNPTGENAEITAALTGRNTVDFAFIPRRHPAINAAGELCDRWGTPFFFHQLSATQMELRSAGPDRKLWTEDDEVLTPGLVFPNR